MAVNSLIDVATHTLIDVGLLLLCNWLLLCALLKLRDCGHINHWVLLFFEAAYTPVLCMLWIMGIFSIYFELSCNDSFDLVIKNIKQIEQLSLTLPFCWFLFRFKKLLIRRLVEKYDNTSPNFDPVLISIFSKIFTGFIICIGLAIIFNLLKIPIDTFMIFRGAFSIALAFAAQSILGNFFGCMMILVNRPFQVGDWISSPDKKVEGTVEEIGWNSTKIRTLERRPLYVPNSIFTHIVIMNSSLMSNRHIKQVICLRYQDADKIEKITIDIEIMLRSHIDIDQDQQIMADWVEFGSHALHIEVYAFTKTINRAIFRKVQQDICIKIIGIIEKQGAKIAIPARCMHVQDHKEKSHL
jgi:MscS family membrane protein